jgi:hypothetical protein
MTLIAILGAVLFNALVAGILVTTLVTVYREWRERRGPRPAGTVLDRPVWRERWPAVSGITSVVRRRAASR